LHSQIPCRIACWGKLDCITRPKNNGVESHMNYGNICRILTELDVLQAEVDALKRLQAETAAELDALLPAILDKAFKGEL